MKLKLYQVDAFAEQVFTGNPAAVCPLNQWIESELMQKIAEENNLAETAFFVKKDALFEIRWFTPEIEVDLCGHATLAAAHVILEHLGFTENTVRFFSPRSGDLSVKKEDDGLLTLDFPVDETVAIQDLSEINQAIGMQPLKTIKGKTDYLLIYPTQKDVGSITPNFHLLDQLDCRGVIVSAPGNEVDFVSRFFAPQCGIPEDPVTGSAHTTMIPYWSKVLGKTKLTARQLSKRGGNLMCEDLGERVKISGKAVTYLIGEINLWAPIKQN